MTGLISQTARAFALAAVAAVLLAGCDEIYVSPSGDDAADGSFASPVKTLRRAQALAREKGGATVWLRGGEYPVRETLALDERDSGTAWRAYGEERPVLTGACRLRGFGPVTDAAMKARFSEPVRERVRAVDLRELGYDGFEPFAPCGLYFNLTYGGDVVRRANMLYRNGRRLTPAREPDEGFLRIGEVLSPTGHVFKVSLPELPRLGKADAPDLVASGYFQYFWDDENVFAEVTDPAAGVVKIEWFADHQVLQNQTMYFQNAPALLDVPGEWYLDRHAGKLYLLPPDDAAADDAWVLAGCARPFLTVDGAHDVRIEGLVFEYGRGDAVRIAKSRNVAFEGNVIRNFCGIGLLAEGANLRIAGNLLYGFGHDAMRVTGGDRKTLTPSGVVVEGNDVSDTGFIQRCYTPGVLLNGCGTRLVRNWFHDLPSSAMRVEGNDYDIVSNLVERVVIESDDQGGSDTYGNPTYAGTVFRYNVWKDIRPEGTVPCGRAGIRFDDAISNQRVYGNRFENCSAGGFGGVQIHGGRCNLVSNNLFVACRYGVSVTPWDQTRWRNYLVSGYYLKSGITVTEPAYVRRYPGIERLPDLPMTNSICCNVMVGAEKEINAWGSNHATGAWGNRSFREMPSAAELAAIPGFVPPPTAEEAGPRPDEPLLRRARRNARCHSTCATAPIGAGESLFPLSDVRLEGGRLGIQQDLNRKYLLWLDPDRLLSRFRSSAGLKPKAPSYAGWEDPDAHLVYLPGHILAFWMAGAAMTVEATGDAELRRRILYVVDELAEVQKAHGCGYALAPEGGRQLWRDVASGKIDVPHSNKREANGWSVNDSFEPIYTLNKVLLGLHYIYRATGSEKAKKVFLDLSDWFGHDVVDRLSDEQVQKLIFCEHGSLPETFAYAERMTGNKKYGVWARRLCANLHVDGMTGDNPDWLTGHHANNDIPRFTGFERVYRLTGEEKLHRAAVNAWADIAGRRTWANGGNSDHEHFFAPAEFEQHLNGSGCESCNSVNMLRLTEALFESDPTSARVDFYERCLYNHILSTHEPGRGRTVYFTSLKPGDYRMYAHAFDSMWCCVGTGLEAPGKYAQMVFTHAADDSAVSVQLFESASLNWRVRGVRLRQTTQFPAGESSRVTVEAVGANPAFALKVRVPAWSPNLTVSVNGAPVEAAADASGYLTVKRTWKPGDAVDISFPMSLRAERLPGSEKYLAFFYGPTLLAGELGREGLEFDDFFSSKDKKNYDGWYHKELPEIRIPTVPSRALADPASALVRDRTLPLAFRLKDDPTVRLVPMMDLHFQRYAIYWPVENADNTKKF